MEILKISSKSNPNSVAGAIAGLVKESNKAEMQAIGAGALNQAVKAVAIARGFVAPSGVDLVCIPAFAEVEVEVVTIDSNIGLVGLHRTIFAATEVVAVISICIVLKCTFKETILGIKWKILIIIIHYS